METKINSRIYQIYFEAKWQSDRDWIFSLFNSHFPNYTFNIEECVWHGSREDTIHITILDDDCLGHRAIMRKLRTIINRYNFKALIESKILVTVCKTEAHFLGGV